MRLGFHVWAAWLHMSVFGWFMFLLPRGLLSCLQGPMALSTQKGRLEPGPNIPNGGLPPGETNSTYLHHISDHGKYKYGAFLFTLLAVLEKSK